MKKGILFIILTVLITWLLWSPSVISQYIEVAPLFLIISMIASFTPTVLGIIYMRKEGMSIKSRLKLDHKKYYLWIPVVFLLVSVVPFLIALNDVGIIYAFPFWMTPLVFLQILVIGGALGEEFGWRGYLYPKLKKHLNPFQATLLVGVVWSLWHLPLFFMEGTVQSNLPIWQFMLQNTIIAFYYLWIYEKTDGNLLLLIYLHAVANTFAAVFPYWQSELARYASVITLLIGLVIVYKIDKVNFKRSA